MAWFSPARRLAAAMPLLCLLITPAIDAGAADGPPAPFVPQFDKDDRLTFPADYREWVYVTTGIDMAYGPAMRMGHSMFDNVFVNREAYLAFKQTGTWPEKTTFVLEVRGAADKGSINKSGHFQTPEVMGLEVHVKDSARFHDDGWGFYSFDAGKAAPPPAEQLPVEQSCYSCHREHGAVNTTFVQFYPTLSPIAEAKKTFSAAYLAENH
ncbi:cytochrome P460 family protein [Nitrospirillum sp. BR 11164]|uniref:cytochrome P460 family protein n=1 Tax=Nitrospirillum sp. BR 11164 TaxID=3104324 RepID=UPI002B001840|nr:cytochrome P460 family protein [Nitrospirillum sp. BR 11164]MEA1648332.1 cytochrome P460 family protein [Nitrospirillum sp. BR 11164]